MLLCGDAIDVLDWHGEPITDDSFLLLLNAAPEAVDFVLPDHAARRWALLLDTTDERGFLEPAPEHPAGKKLPLTARSFALLRRVA